MWNALDYDVAIAFYAWLPNLEYRRHASTARLGFMFESFARGSGDMPEFTEWLEPWMRPITGDEKPRSNFYSEAVIADVDLAFKLDLLSQDALIALGPKRLRASGAFRGP